MASASNVAPHEPSARHVFVSYAHADAGFTDRFVPDLILARIPIWIDHTGLKPGTPDWQLAVRSAITNAVALILIASPSSVRSLAVQGEVKVARDNQVPIFTVWALGSVWSECVPFELMNSHYVDCRDQAYDEGLRAAVQAIRLEIERRRPSRPSPKVLCINPRSKTLGLTPRGGISDNSDKMSASGDEPVQGAADTTGEMDVAYACASQAYQIASLLSTIATRDEFEIVHLAGYEVVAGEPPGTIDGSQTTAKSQDQPPMLTASQLSEILTMSLPAHARLVVLVVPSAAVRSSGPEDLSDPGVSALLETLVSCAPYVLAVAWDRSAPSAVTAQALDVFFGTFYRSYAHSRSIETSLSNAQLQLRVRHLSHLVTACTRKRAHYTTSGALVVEAHITGLPDSITIDLSPVQESLTALDLSEEQLFHLLARKIRAHKVAFATPREHAILSIDSILHGEFSWDTSAGTIVCTKLFRFRDDIDPRHWENWCRLLVTYNDLCAEGYRQLAEPGLPTARTIITQSLHRFERKYELLDAVTPTLVEVGCQQAWMPFAEGKINLEMAADKLAEDESGEAGAYLEMALSCLHTMVDMCKPPVVAETA